MWSRNVVPELLSHWSFLDLFFASLLLLETPYFIVFLYKFHLRCLKLGHNLGQNFRPSKTSLNSGRAVLRSLNCPSKWDPESKQEKQKHNKRKMITSRTQRFFCRKKRFRRKKKKDNFDVLPLGSTQ